GCHTADLLFPHAGFDLVEEREVDVGLCELRKQGFQVIQVHYVVDRVQAEASVLVGDGHNLFIYPVWILFAECHCAAIQSAKGAVRLSSPPASTGGFERKNDSEQFVNAEAVHLFHILGVVRHRGVVKVLERDGDICGADDVRTAAHRNTRDFVKVLL